MTASPPPVSRWRDEHAAARQTVIQAYLDKRRPRTLLSGLSKAADDLFRQIWQAHDLPARSALLAVGGYGRGELYPQSDVDVLILMDDDLSAAQQGCFAPLIGLFWDVGLPVGHSVRTRSECLAESARDVTIQTNLLEARLLAGDANLFQRFMDDYQRAMNPLAFLQAKLLEQKNRHGRAAGRFLLLEPNIKENPGGLRDLHMVGWVCRAAGLPADLPGLAREGLIDASEAKRIGNRERFLSHLRIRLHLAVNRREDRLVFEQQEPLAEAMGIRPTRTRRAAEVLMQRYFQAAREISLANEFLLDALRCRLKPLQVTQPLADAPGFLQREMLLDIVRDDLYEHDPEALFATFLALTRHPELQGLTPRALRALWRAGRRIDKPFRDDPLHQRQFLDLLNAPRGLTQALRLMHRLGLLGRYLPSFGRITGQMQHDLFHIYPVDEHILMVLRNLRRLATPEFAHEFPLAHRLMADFPRPDLLYVAALFHDIAKGRGGDHSLLGERDARRFCRQHGLSRDDADLVSWLVRDHLIMSGTAQQQDLSDAAVIERFTRRCGSLQRLTALYLLTVSDIRGTNPNIWNAWKAQLLRELYLASRRLLEGGQPTLDSVEAKKAEARANLRLHGFETDVERDLWLRLDDVWFLRLSADEIAWQTRRLLQQLEQQAVVVSARLAAIGQGVEVMVYCPDQQALFARICGFFSNMGYTVLQAKIHSTRDGYALDSFLAMDEENPQVAYRDLLSYIEYELAQEIREQKPLAEGNAKRLPRQLKYFPIEPDVTLESVEDGRGHVLVLSAGDRPGLLYDVARVLHRHHANVLSAKINTLGQRAEDTFVLSSEALERASQRLALQRELVEVLSVHSTAAAPVSAGACRLA